MLRYLPTVLFILVLLCPSSGHGEPSTPGNYDECILDAMKGVSSDVAARAIIDSCRNLFPASQDQAPAASPAPALASAPAAPPAPVLETPLAAELEPLGTMDARDLTPEELGELGARAKVFGSNYRVTIDNRNPHLTLTEVTIGIWDDTGIQVGREDYSEAVQIPPETSAEVKYTVHYRGDPAGWQWGVVAARGVADAGGE